MTARQTKAETTVVCPNCGHRFRLDDQITQHIHADWEREARQRLRRELREEASVKAEDKVRKEFAKELREKEEELRASGRRLRRVERQLQTASQKASQKPSQELGVVRQETLQSLLAARFENDEFRPITSGRKGGDLVQLVRDATGHACGSILWESKRGYQSWSNRWVSKLRADQRAEGCALGVIVSDVLPDGEVAFCAVGGALACDMSAAPYLALLLRERLLEVAGVRGARARRDDLKGAVYDYVSGPFIGYIQRTMEAISSMKVTLDKEKRAKTADWKQREGEIDGIAYDLAATYGELQAIGAALPSVPELQMPGSELKALPR
ncbi:MAG: DUF2130 domain-containing protein [Solirubrobacteraceae bacterium]